LFPAHGEPFFPVHSDSAEGTTRGPGGTARGRSYPARCPRPHRSPIAAHHEQGALGHDDDRVKLSLEILPAVHFATCPDSRPPIAAGFPIWKPPRVKFRLLGNIRAKPRRASK
jgi:hypothetical protein